MQLCLLKSATQDLTINISTKLFTRCSKGLFKLPILPSHFSSLWLFNSYPVCSELTSDRTRDNMGYILGVKFRSVAWKARKSLTCFTTSPALLPSQSSKLNQTTLSGMLLSFSKHWPFSFCTKFCTEGNFSLHVLIFQYFIGQALYSDQYGNSF